MARREEHGGGEERRGEVRRDGPQDGERRDGHDGAGHDGAGRGREAGSPREIPARGWRDVLLRVKGEAKHDNLGIVAAGVAFYGFLSLFPALAAVISIWGLVADPATVQAQIMGAAGTLPSESRSLLEQQLTQLAGRSGGALSFSAAISILLALWSANKGMSALVDGLNIVYDEEETRGFFKRTATTLALTLGGIVLVLLAAAAVVVVPALLGRVGLSDEVQAAIEWLRWPFIAIAVAVGLSVIYRYAPDRGRARWQWVSWGSVIATLLWLAGSVLFSVYVSRFGSYDKTYGSLAAVIVLMLWFLLSAYAVLLGAEINAEMEHQTRRDTTTGAERPLGARGAFSADTVGETP